MITCTACGYDQNLDNTEFCTICGSELPVAVTTSPTIIQPAVLPTPETNYPPVDTHSAYSYSGNTSTTAKLVSKQTNAPLPEFIVENNAIVGIFDQDTGPVDIDLEAFSVEKPYPAITRKFIGNQECGRLRI